MLVPLWRLLPQGSSSNGGTPAPSRSSGNELRSGDSDKKDADDAGNDEGENEKPGDRDDDNDNPDHDEPDDPTDGTLTSELPVVSFDAQAKVYANTANTVTEGPSEAAGQREAYKSGELFILFSARKLMPQKVLCFTLKTKTALKDMHRIQEVEISRPPDDSDYGLRTGPR